MGTARITGMDELLDMLDKRTQDRIIKRANAKLAAITHREAVKYPPPPQMSRYRRTNTLGRRWTISSVTKDGATVSNVTDYAPYVQEQGEQSRIHQGRWKTDEKIGEENVKEYGDLLIKEFQRETGEKVR